MDQRVGKKSGHDGEYLRPIAKFACRECGSVASWYWESMARDGVDGEYMFFYCDCCASDLSSMRGCRVVDLFEEIVGWD